MLNSLSAGVYRILNLLNGKVYIGSSAISFKSRWASHISRLKKNRHENAYLQNSWNKHGADNFKFEKLEEVSHEEHLSKEEFLEALLGREQHWLDHYKSYDRDKGYNVCLIAGSSFGIKRTQEQVEKNKKTQRDLYRSGEMLSYNAKLNLDIADEIRKRYIEEPVNTTMLAQDYGSNRSTVARILAYKSYVRPEDRAKDLKPIKKKIVFTLEARQNLSKAHIGQKGYWEGKKRDPRTIEKMRRANLGRKQSQDEKDKRANSLRGQKRSEDHKRKMSEMFSGQNSPSAKLTVEMVKQIRKEYTDGTITQKGLAERYNVSRSCIEGVIRNDNWHDENYTYTKRNK